jgi:hypothetical protein
MRVSAIELDHIVPLDLRCTFQSEVAGTDHTRELPLKVVFHVRIARAGPRLEHQIAEVERGSTRSRQTGAPPTKSGSTANVAGNSSHEGGPDATQT